MTSGVAEFALRRNDPPPTGSNLHYPDLRFEGKLVIEAEEVWNDTETRGTRLDGEILDRLAIYKKRARGFWRWRVGGGYVEQQRRYNLRVMFNPRANTDNPIPFFSMAVEFDTFDQAVAWIVNSSLIGEGRLMQRFRERVEQHRRG